MDERVEEDEPVHPQSRERHRRAHIGASSRHLRVEPEPTTVAETRQRRILPESGPARRHHGPLPDIRTELLVFSLTETHCAYEATATHRSPELDGHRRDDLVWTYRTPLSERHKDAGPPSTTKRCSCTWTASSPWSPAGPAELLPCQ